MRKKAVIALDGDGVLVDYHQAYRAAWANAFGAIPAVRDPQAYWPLARFDVRRLAGEEMEHFRRQFNEEFWSTIPPIPGAVDACHALVAAGFELVCVSAIDPNFQAARLQNLRECGFPINHVIATANNVTDLSPKAQVLHELKPVAFVDDYLPFLKGIPSQIHAALILREPNGSPNVGEDMALAHSRHADLAGFVDWWLAGIAQNDEIHQNYGNA
ncbi:HAD family hydrolase [Noviherbaspirillum sedimenti]|uniref:HAD family hydrolase n=1 Tax=Noviherbaspirillum sedimenti TaxID=2320865 RepID=A0A3A3G084_9BURK|nr:HAD family hydrolase [Noviherbaspirillum sedimenti]RJG01331.1 HAD family hydrolase [Noviherbaspirillum sedimenti]